MMASSSGTLSYHLTRLSLALKRRQRQNLIVLSGPREQTDGLSTELKNAGIEHFTSKNIDLKGIYDIYRSKEHIKNLLKKKDVDVIHAQGAIHTLEAYLAVKSLRSDETPSIVTSVHSIPNGELLQRPKRIVMTTVLNVCSHMILPVSYNTKELLIRHRLNPQKTVVVHNAVDLDVFDNVARQGQIGVHRRKGIEPAIVCAANLIYVKGQEYYLLAAAEVLKTHPGTFYVVGSGPRRKQLEELVHRLGIEKDVVFTGRIQWPEIYYLLSDVADICVSAALKEEFPFYILECMAARKPIVATNVGGVSEAVKDGVSGYLVPPKDPTSLAKAILKLIDCPDHARQMGKKGRRLVEQRFSMEVITNKLNDIYESALQ